MIRRALHLSTLALCLAATTISTGCVEEARCREACEHTCDVCDTGCSEEAIKTCTQSCEDGQTTPARTECVLDADLCEDLWRC